MAIPTTPRSVPSLSGRASLRTRCRRKGMPRPSCSTRSRKALSRPLVASQGLGAANPVGSNNMSQGRAQNRCGEVRTHPEGACGVSSRSPTKTRASLQSPKLHADKHTQRGDRDYAACDSVKNIQALRRDSLAVLRSINRFGRYKLVERLAARIVWIDAMWWLSMVWRQAGPVRHHAIGRYAELNWDWRQP